MRDYTFDDFIKLAPDLIADISIGNPPVRIQVPGSSAVIIIREQDIEIDDED